MSYIIAIDGGGTTTKCALAKDNLIIATHSCETAKPNVIGCDASAKILFHALLDTCIAGDLPFNQVRKIVIGQSGVWSDKECTTLLKKLFDVANERMYALPKTQIISDALIAYKGALGERRGIVVIAGTGSIAVTVDSQNIVHRAGGYGSTFSDEGSGAWIGKQAIIKLISWADGSSRHSPLFNTLAKRYNASFPEDVREFVAMATNGSISCSEISPLVFRYAEDKDSVCKEILHTAADELISLANSLIKFHRSKQVSLCFLGGVAEQSYMQKILRNKIKEQSRIEIVRPLGSALIGALSLAQNTMQ